MSGLGLTDAESLPFGDNEVLQTSDDIPKYLFRVFTNKSHSFTDSSWARSADANQENPGFREDIISRPNQHNVAQMVVSHLRWWRGPDNLVSWTSSLLCALSYIFHLRCSSRDGSPFDQVYLCIVKSTGFPRRTFIRDTDLIQAYSKFNTSLEDFGELRGKKHKRLSGHYYFGEYLSQGALKIKGNCQVVSAQLLIDNGLLDILPEFEELARREHQEKTTWALETLKLRERFYANCDQDGIYADSRLDAAIRVASVFGPEWRLAIAANLIGLIPRPKNDTVASTKLRSGDFIRKYITTYSTTDD